MPTLAKPAKLEKGTIQKLAHRFKKTYTHVYLVAQAERQGSEKLIEALKREEAKQLQESAA